MVGRKNQAAKVWEGQGWLAERGYKDADDLLTALVELANLPGTINHDIDPAIIRAVSQFEERWPGFLPFDGSPSVQVEAAQVRRRIERTKSVLNWRDQLREAWAGVSGFLQRLLFADYSYTDDDPIEVDWLRREFVYRPGTAFQAACYLLLKNSHLAKVCANPNCTGRRYFIADRAQRRYCSQACFEPFQLQRSLDWWNRVGKDRRDKAKRQSKRKRGKQ